MIRIAQILIFALALTTTGLFSFQQTVEAQAVVAPWLGSSAVTSEIRPMMTRKSRDELKEIFKNSIVDSRLRLPDEKRIGAFKDLIEKTLDSRSVSSELNQQWRQEGWECRTLSDSNVVVVTERSGQRWGRGIYAIRTKGNSRVVLQAPHRFSDAKTGVIARKIFQEHDVWAVGFNTIHRRELDLAHCERHYFNAFTEAVVQVRSRAIVLQLHGFTNKEKTNAGKTASLIVSDSSKFPGRYARQVAEEFKSEFGKSHTRLYPIETRWLGGTHNRQASLIQQLGSRGFLHLEMNPGFRQQLVTEASTRRLFFASISSAIAE